MQFSADQQLEDKKSFIQGLLHRKNSEITEASGIPLLCEREYVYADAEDHHTLIFGNTGTKKTRNFVIPNVFMLANAGESIVITDPKGEIYDAASGYLTVRGYDIQVINLRDMKNGSQWNPLSVPYYFYKNGMKDRAMEMTADFAAQLTVTIHSDRDVYWENTSASTLEGFILLLFEYASDESEVTIENVLRLSSCVRPFEGKKDPSGISKTDAEKFWQMMDSLPSDSMIRTKLASVISLKGVDRTLGSIVGVLNQMLMVFMINRELLTMMACNDIDMEQAGMKSMAIFLIIPNEKKTFHFLASVFVKQFYEMLIYKAQQQPGHTLPVRVNFILDEFANLTQIKDMSSMISAARSRNIRFTLVIQSKAQMNSLYGEAEAETIKSNCATWIVLPCRELSLLREISELCGYAYYDERRGYRPVIDISDIQGLKIGRNDGQALILRRGKNAYVSWVKDYRTYPQTAYSPVPQNPAGHKEGTLLTISTLLRRVTEHPGGSSDQNNLIVLTYIAFFDNFRQDKSESALLAAMKRCGLPTASVKCALYYKKILQKDPTFSEDMYVSSENLDELRAAYTVVRDALSPGKSSAVAPLPMNPVLFCQEQKFGEAFADASIHSIEIAADTFFEEAAVHKKRKREGESTDKSIEGIMFLDRVCRNIYRLIERPSSVYIRLIKRWRDQYTQYGTYTFPSMTFQKGPKGNQLPEKLICTQPFLLLIKCFDVLKRFIHVADTLHHTVCAIVDEDMLSRADFTKAGSSDGILKKILHDGIVLMYEMLLYLLPFDQGEFRVAFSGCLSQMRDYYNGAWIRDPDENSPQIPGSNFPQKNDGCWELLLDTLSSLAEKHPTGYTEIINTYREKSKK